MRFEEILQSLYDHNEIIPLLCVGSIALPTERMNMELLKMLDYKGRGAKALYTDRFVLEGSIAFIRKTFKVKAFKKNHMRFFFGWFKCHGYCLE
jgi:hypothetical protein